MGEIAIASTGKPEKEVAAEFKDRARVMLGGLTSLMDEIDRHGMALQFGCGRDGFGRNVVTMLNIVKTL
jgi:hypothetical protein